MLISASTLPASANAASIARSASRRSSCKTLIDTVVPNISAAPVTWSGRVRQTLAPAAIAPSPSDAHRKVRRCITRPSCRWRGGVDGNGARTLLFQHQRRATVVALVDHHAIHALEAVVVANPAVRADRFIVAAMAAGLA